MAMSRRLALASVVAWVSLLLLPSSLAAATAHLESSVSRGATGAVHSSDTGRPAATAVKPARTPTLARTEGRHSLRVLAPTLLALAISVIGLSAVSRGLARVLELAIKAVTTVPGPEPGRRAPPVALAL